MATALPKIDQVAKPAGIAGNSRDDLDLFTGPNPIQLSDGGVGAVSWLWQLLDQPFGGTATLTTPLLSTTDLTVATLPGSYLIQLTVNGGGNVGEIYRVIAGIQIPLPSWVGPAGLSKLRIPAFGE